MAEIWFIFVKVWCVCLSVQWKMFNELWTDKPIGMQFSGVEGLFLGTYIVGSFSTLFRCDLFWIKSFPWSMSASLWMVLLSLVIPFLKAFDKENKRAGNESITLWDLEYYDLKNWMSSNVGRLDLAWLQWSTSFMVIGTTGQCHTIVESIWLGKQKCRIWAHYSRRYWLKWSENWISSNFELMCILKKFHFHFHGFPTTFIWITNLEKN